MKETAEEHYSNHELQAALWRLDILVQQALIMGCDDSVLGGLLAKALREIRALTALTTKD